MTTTIQKTRVNPYNVRHLSLSEKRTIAEIVESAGPVEVLRLLSTLVQNQIENLEDATSCAESIRVAAQKINNAGRKS